MMEFVSWDDEIPNMMGKIKHVPNHQPVYVHRHASKFGSITIGQVGQVNT